MFLRQIYCKKQAFVVFFLVISILYSNSRALQTLVHPRWHGVFVLFWMRIGKLIFMLTFRLLSFILFFFRKSLIQGNNKDQIFMKCKMLALIYAVSFLEMWMLTGECPGRFQVFWKGGSYV